MKKIQNLALGLLAYTQHMEEGEFEIASGAIETVLKLLKESGCVLQDFSVQLTEEYERMNKQDDEEILKEFFG
ncbi:hypothetical protein D3C85_1584000 [compost metagenome]